MFGTEPGRGNPLAVVVDGEGLGEDEMRRFANWTNLSETTFLLPPTDPRADYRVRIFTTTGELPFAGHPTLGSCRAWLDNGGVPGGEMTVQQCGAGLVTIQRTGERLAFTAPPLLRSGPPDTALQARIESTIGQPVLDAAWVDNGPGWVAARVADAAAVLAIEPDWRDSRDLKLGVIGAAPPGADHDFEVRAFFPGPTAMAEDPVTGSLNASLAQWLMGADPTLDSYVVRQGTAIGRDGRVFVDRDEHGQIWVGGEVARVITGHVDI